MLTRGRVRQAERVTCTAVSTWMESQLGSKVVEERRLGGSQWASAYNYVLADGQRLFVKTSRGRDASMFKGEALGLQAMYGALEQRGRHASSGIHPRSTCICREVDTQRSAAHLLLKSQMRARCGCPRCCTTVRWRAQVRAGHSL